MSENPFLHAQKNLMMLIFLKAVFLPAWREDMKNIYEYNIACTDIMKLKTSYF